jgi:putative endonuclease
MKFGTRGERVAARHLKRLGYRILKKNYTCAVGEIDIIAADGDQVVFVEVKTRRSDEAADPENSVNRAKQRKIIRTAKVFLSQYGAQNIASRFDVISVLLPDGGKAAIEHFIDAFAAVRR